MSAKKSTVLMAKLGFCVLSATVMYIQPWSVFAKTDQGPAVTCPTGCIKLNNICVC